MQKNVNAYMCVYEKDMCLQIYWVDACVIFFDKLWKNEWFFCGEENVFDVFILPFCIIQV